MPNRHGAEVEDPDGIVAVHGYSPGQRQATADERRSGMRLARVPQEQRDGRVLSLTAHIAVGARRIEVVRVRYPDVATAVGRVSNWMSDDRLAVVCPRYRLNQPALRRNDGNAVGANVGGPDVSSKVSHEPEGLDLWVVRRRGSAEGNDADLTRIASAGSE